ncbi:MAG: Maf family protein [Acidiferrobacterales bacterium]
MSKIYLASNSPRRQALLQQLGIGFDIIIPDVVEQTRGPESAAEFAQRMAAKKARQALRQIDMQHLPLRPVLAADTCVVLDDDIFGKPRDREDGEAMLRRLSGREHIVVTAVTVLHSKKEHSVLNTSRVIFRSLSEDEIHQYWDTGEPADKAGAYALQGKAAAFIARIEGSYSGIVGLPLYEVAQLLRQAGLTIP